MLGKGFSRTVVVLLLIVVLKSSCLSSKGKRDLSQDQDIQIMKRTLTSLINAINSAEMFNAVDKRGLDENLSKRDTDTNNTEVTECEPGPAGPPGPPGKDGVNGNYGKDGGPGKPGTHGSDGANGENGKDGENGLKGGDGKDGINGKDGANGPMGPPGPAGPQGVAGEAGSVGPAGNAGEAGAEGASGISGGAVYTRFGRKECGNQSSLIYEGFVGSSSYNQAGGGVNYQCLPLTPEYGSIPTGSGSTSSMYGSEYESASIGLFPKDANNQNVPCARCDTETRSALMMEPAVQTCPDGWTTEYNGFLMSAYMSHAHPSTFECVDSDPEYIADSATNKNGALFYFIKTDCATTGECPPYDAKRALTCVVCSN